MGITLDGKDGRTTGRRALTSFRMAEKAAAYASGLPISVIEVFVFLPLTQNGNESLGPVGP